MTDKEKHKILYECECGLFFKVYEEEAEKMDRMCDLIPENDLSHRKKKCHLTEES